MRAPTPFTRWQLVQLPLPVKMARPFAALPALAAARLAFARRNRTIAAACASEKLFGGIAVFGMPRSTMPTSSGSVVARRKRPWPRSTSGTSSPSGPWHSMQFSL